MKMLGLIRIVNAIENKTGAVGRRSLPRRVRDTLGRAVEVGEFEPRHWEGVLATYRSLAPAQRPPGLPPLTEERLAVWVDALWRRGLNVVARSGERVVGHAALVERGAGSYELVAVVGDEHQGTGVGDALLDAALSLLPEQGAGRVWSTLDRRNDLAASLYRRAGFRRESGDGWGRDTWVLDARALEGDRREQSPVITLAPAARTARELVRDMVRGAARVWLRAEATVSPFLARTLFPMPAALTTPAVPRSRSDGEEAAAI